jgi:hypothetical protein
MMRGVAVNFHHQNIRWLQIAMDDGFLMCVLHAIACLDEQLEPRLNAQFFSIAVFRNRFARHVLHHEVWLAVGRRAGVEDFGDGRMVHQGKRLAFGLEAVQQGIVVHSGAN